MSRSITYELSAVLSLPACVDLVSCTISYTPTEKTVWASLWHDDLTATAIRMTWLVYILMESSRPGDAFCIKGRAYGTGLTGVGLHSFHDWRILQVPLTLTLTRGIPRILGQVRCIGGSLRKSVASEDVKSPPAGLIRTEMRSAHARSTQDCQAPRRIRFELLTLHQLINFVGRLWLTLLP